jgi:hypothetical protein
LNRPQNGSVLEYIGRGKSLVDVGLAQARTPIGTRNHYFEIEVHFEHRNLKFLDF